MRLFDDPSTGLLFATVEFQAVANIMTEDGTPLEPVPVGEPATSFAFYDPGANCLPWSLWTVVGLIGFASSLALLDRIEQREKRMARFMVE